MSKKFVLLLSILFIFYLFKGVIYCFFIKYESISERNPIKINDESTEKILDSWLHENPNVSIDALINIAQMYATEGIDYTFKKCNTNPNQIIKHQEDTNCIGYSANFATIFTYLIAKKGLENKITVSHNIGKLSFFGHDIHAYFSDPAFQNHDFNIVSDNINHINYAVDSTVYTYFGIKRITLKEK
jgi:hypothetical protein